MSLFSILTIITSLAFLSYGISCMFSTKMVLEFKRFGLTNIQRLITGIAQILGAIGLFLGYFIYPLIGLMAASGLAILMFLGFLVRIKVRDSFSRTFPSFFFMLLTIALAFSFYRIL